MVAQPLCDDAAPWPSAPARARARESPPDRAGRRGKGNAGDYGGGRRRPRLCPGRVALYRIACEKPDARNDRRYAL